MARKGLSPVQRTLRELRNQGSIAEVVEKWNPYAGIHGKRIDLFGIIDIIALAPDGIIGIQACANSGFAAHVAKISSSDLSVEWLKSGGRLALWGWGKYKLKMGGKAMRWKAKIKEFYKEDFE